MSAHHTRDGAVGTGGAGLPPRTAIYLRCYPFDPAEMDCHRRALEGLAAESGLPLPTRFLDNGLRGSERLPALENLLRAVAAGWVDTLLIPGPFVFGLDQGVVAVALSELERLGCRLMELPCRGARTGPSALTEAA
ncbi:hypothetical protein ACGFX4_11010 [Kitasatospora sp. NPDC048365]|uniref:hypothetical protein n=1 Tax=Kitasatospora sp. NPDC048365 TaxID=3364050 RepID=UPI00371BAFD1